MMARLRNRNSGAVVQVDDKKVARLGAEWVAIDADTQEPSGYGSLKVDDLKAEIDRRNEGRDEDSLLSTEGKKADLIATLEADDEE